MYSFSMCARIAQVIATQLTMKDRFFGFHMRQHLTSITFKAPVSIQTFINFVDELHLVFGRTVLFLEVQLHPWFFLLYNFTK